MKPSILITKQQTNYTQSCCYSSFISYGLYMKIPLSPIGPVSLSIFTHKQTHSNFYQTSPKQSFGSRAYLFIAPVPSSLAFTLLMIMKPTKPCNTQKILNNQPQLCHGVAYKQGEGCKCYCKSVVCCQQNAVFAVQVISNSFEFQYKRELRAKMNHVTDGEIHSNSHSNFKLAAASL